MGTTWPSGAKGDAARRIAGATISSTLLVGVATFLGAFLLFGAELLVGKAALPHFGGSPAIWTTILFFFQLMLLLGYSYARWLGTLQARLQRRLHIGLLVMGTATLAAQAVAWGVPVLPGGGGAREPGAWEVTRFLTVAVALPCFALCSTAPLVQTWVARMGSGVPWRLYALSNAGALCALAAYPTMIELLLGLRAQAWAWMALFAANAAAFAAVTLRLACGPDSPPGAAVGEKVPATRWGAWLLLSAMGTGLLSATSTMLCQDVSPGPLMWAPPLATYLLSFIIAFDHERWYRRAWVLTLFAVAMSGAACVLWIGPTVSLAVQAACFLALQLGGSLFCHGELYRLRPPPERLGAYYLAIAAGGAAGTLLVSIAAPVLFDDFWEFPAIVAGVALACVAVLARRADGTRAPVFAGRLAEAMVIALLAGMVVIAFQSKRDLQKYGLRNFLGVLRVMERAAGDPQRSFILFHGDIVHGQQFASDALRAVPTTYYGWESGLGVSVKYLRQVRRGGLHAAVLGLGVGTAAALFEAGDRIDFYEINPDVVRLAKGEAGFFSYLRDTRAAWDVRVGDARIEMASESAAGASQKDLVVVDTFNGDAIPVHLITLEAVKMYLTHLKPDGVLALHISNRHLDLTGVVSGIAREQGLGAAVLRTPMTGTSKTARWAMMSRDEAWIRALQESPPAVREGLYKPRVVWTDDRSSLFDALRY